MASGSTLVSARISGAADTSSDLDLYLFNCTTGTCVQRAAGETASSNEFVSSLNPVPGLWKVVVSPYAVPAGSTAFDYQDTIANLAFGSVSVTDANALRVAGSSWTVPAVITAKVAPATGRVLLGTVQVRTDGNVLVGSGDVIVQNVTP